MKRELFAGLGFFLLGPGGFYVHKLRRPTGASLHFRLREKQATAVTDINP
jgi:hypothetical protein